MSYLRKLEIKLVDGQYRNPVEGQVKEPRQIYDVFQRIKDEAQETLIGVYLNADLIVNNYAVLSVGTRSETLVDAPAIFVQAFAFRSRYIILVHSHPSGKAEPSKSDRDTMYRLLEQSKVMELALLDFIIVAGDGYWSMFEEADGGEYPLGTAV